MHGTGTWKFFGNEYTGDFVNNKKNGKGEMSYFSGERYSGDWMNDLPRLFFSFPSFKYLTY